MTSNGFADPPSDPGAGQHFFGPALGVVLTDHRGSLPFTLLRGESLVAIAAWALGEADVTLVDASVPWSGLLEADEPVVLHDPLCPLVPPAFLAECVAEAVRTGRPVVAVRSVTDTVKHLDGARLGATLDRDALRSVCSPVVLPADAAARWDDWPPDDLVVLADRLCRAGDVAWVEAPPQARRIGSADDVGALEALLQPSG